MDGLLLRLLADTRSVAGRWFWPCFEPLRTEFDRYFWVVLNQPWFGAPDEFDGEREIAEYDGMACTSVMLWRPGAVGRWAERFGEESIDIWAIDPERNPVRTASAFSALRRNDDDFTETHGTIRLIYTDSCCWEIFAKETRLLAAVRDHLQCSASIRVYETSSANREPAFDAAALRETWRALQGGIG